MRIIIVWLEEFHEDLDSLLPGLFIDFSRIEQILFHSSSRPIIEISRDLHYRYSSIEKSSLSYFTEQQCTTVSHRFTTLHLQSNHSHFQHAIRLC